MKRILATMSKMPGAQEEKMLLIYISAHPSYMIRALRKI
jgi:hypothetical protein